MPRGVSFVLGVQTSNIEVRVSNYQESETAS